MENNYSSSNFTLELFVPIFPSKEVLDYISTFISFVTFVFSLVSLLVFVDFKEKIFVYLKIGQFWILLAMAINMFYTIFWIDKKLVSTLVWPIYFKFFFVNFTSTCELCAFASTILSALVFLSMIDKKWDCAIFNTSPYIIVGIMSIIGYVLFCYQLFQFEINLISNNYFVSINFSNSDSKWLKAIELIAFSIRDGALLFIMLFLNIVLYKKFRLTMRKKKKMLTSSASTSNGNVSTVSTNQLVNQKQETINKANKNLNLMILFQCLDSTFERVPVFIVFVIRNINLIDQNTFLLLIPVVKITIQLAYFFKFFIFYFFNTLFRKKLNTFVFKFRQKLK
jgi:hypothetical protein